jgi:MoaA/NifB/PqqE/SkfB family radical SAM enzyme
MLRKLPVHTGLTSLALGPMTGKPVMAYYYVTYKCTARCTFCNIPDGPMDVIPVSRYSSSAQSVEHFKILKRIGVRLIDFTGGEPLLKKNLPALLRAAKDLGLKTQMTTNCTLYPRRAKELVGLVDIMNFSLVGPTAEIHNPIRRDTSFNDVLKSMRIARELGEPYQLIFVLTNSNIDQLEPMIELAREYQAILKVQPEFDLFGNGNVDLRHVRRAEELARASNVYVNLAETSIFDTGNVAEKPRCRAANAVIVVSPDGYVLYPCYHQVTTKIPLDANFERLFHSRKWRQMQDEVGRFSFCDGCRNLCYLHPSFLYRFDRLFVLSAFSDIRYLKERVRIDRERARTLAAIAEGEAAQPGQESPRPVPLAAGR